MDGPLTVAVLPFSTKETGVLRSHMESLLVAEITFVHVVLAFYEKLQALIKKNFSFFSSQVHIYSE